MINTLLMSSKEEKLSSNPSRSPVCVCLRLLSDLEHKNLKCICMKLLEPKSTHTVGLSALLKQLYTHVSLIASLIPLLLFPSLITRLRIVYFISVLHLVLED